MNLLTPQSREYAISELIGLFESERGERIGVIAAESVLDKVLESVGKGIYKTAVNDISKLISERDESLKYDLEMLIES